MQCNICLEEKYKFYTLHDNMHQVCTNCFEKIKSEKNVKCPFCRKKIYLFIYVRKITYIQYPIFCLLKLIHNCRLSWYGVLNDFWVKKHNLRVK